MGEPAVVTPPVNVSVEPSGIGGWLILVAIGQLFAPLRAIANLATYYGDKDILAVFDRLPVAMYGEAFINVGYLVFIFVTSYTFLAHKRSFKTMYTIEFLAGVLVVELDMARVSIAPGTSIDGSKFGDAFARAFWDAALGIIWVPYIWLSKRGRNTFAR